MRQIWQYQNDPDWAEYVMSPEFQIHQAEENGYFYGDCDDASTLAGCISYCLGIPSRFVAYRMRGNPDYSHVNLCCHDGFYIDPTVTYDRLPIQNGVEETMVMPV